jgi:single-stranded-DNA-specific exonuclease
MRWIETSPALTSSPLPDLHPLVGQMLIRRGMTTVAAARAFLDPDSYSPSPATDLPGLSAAADRVTRTIRAGDAICVWGDFDVDGQTSTTVLVQTLQALGADVAYHIPVRAQESHGVNIENLARIIAQGAKLVVTCDTGITAHTAVDYARSRGVDMVITDHHDLPPELPNATAIVNPKLLPKDHPLATLAGVGVAYKLAEYLLTNNRGRRTEENPSSLVLGHSSDLLDLVALGLVADLAILHGDTRYLVQKGLVQLRNTQRLGLKTMLELAELTPAYLTEEHIGFTLGPRLNALGRLGDANPVVELLTTSDPMRARVLATQLEGLNAQRKLLCDQVTQAAETQLRQNPELLAQPILVLAHPTWPGGVVGIVASRLVERYRKPAILLTAPPNEPIRGSARSIEGLNITAAIAAQEDILLGFGGHPMAAGLSLEAEKLPEFRRRLAKTVEKLLGESQLEEAALKIDGWLSLDEANLDLAENLETLAPFGPGNEKPILATRNLTVKSSAALGKNKEHLKPTVEDEDGNSRQVLWWDGGREEVPESKFDLAYTLRASDWRGVRQAQLEWVDFRAIEREKLEVSSKKLEVIDYRGIRNPSKLLSTFNLQPATSIWAEGAGKKEVNGLGRNELKSVQTLIVWTTPPSREELKAALEAVRPEKVIVFAIDPGTDDFQAFMERLAGLAKFVLNKKAGKTSYAELAAATAQKAAAVRLGMEWLTKRGQVSVESESGDQIVLTAGGSSDESAAETVKLQLLSILNETSAFRQHFQKADAQTLIG